ncbi:MAG TPA: 5-methyltetrahydrofolate--homocysteine methyltransferase, partial [Cellvibrio sp.]|nr:5-methyltetrahydrofolate--homocysteine methyltransferase [Cellvibrio sp.]
MNSRFQMPFLAVLLCLSFSACDSANTTITEKDPLVGNKPDDHDHGHAGEGEGRLVVISSVSPTAEIYDLEDNSLVDAFSLELTPSAVQASAGYRYAVLVNRTADQVNFLDGGLWQEAHLDHFDSYEEAPR